MTSRTLIVVPTYQESANIDELLRRVACTAPDVDVLVVDDGSPDGTADIAESVGRELGHVTVLHRDAKNGLGAAYRAGFAWGLERGYDVLVEMDADLSHDPAALPSLLHAVRCGADLAVGSRYVAGGATLTWSTRRRLLSRAGNAYARTMLGIGTADATSGYRAYRATALDAIGAEASRATGYAFQIELTYGVTRAGGRISEVPIVFNDRTRGTSKMSGRIALEALALVTWWSLRNRVFRRNAPMLQRTTSSPPSTGARAAA
jgi:dolichol-phosphate mannosyltransferase